jgi:hypothetical protein
MPVYEKSLVENFFIFDRHLPTFAYEPGKSLLINGFWLLVSRLLTISWIARDLRLSRNVTQTDIGSRPGQITQDEF